MELFITFFKIGLFTFGGGYAMIPLIKQEVLKHGWASVNDILNFIGISEATPGPFAINISTFIGFKSNGILGSFCSTIGVVLPSFIIILIVSKFFFNFQDNKYVRGVLSGLRPAVIGLILCAGISIFVSNFFDNSIVDIKGLLIFALTFMIYLKKKKMHPAFLILISGGFGLLFYGFV